MKRIAITMLFLLGLGLIAFADPPAVSSAPALGQNEAFVILNGLPLYQEQGGSLVWKENLVIGDRVLLLNKAQKFKTDGKDRDYLKIRAPSNLEGWVRVQYVVPKSSLAVIKSDKAIVYSEPRDVKITSHYVSNMTIVAVLQDAAAGSFAKLVCYDATQDAYYTDPIYVSRDDLSYADADINSVILYVTAVASKNKDIKSNLLKVIEKRYSASIFFDKIQAVLSSFPAGAASPVKAVQAANGFYTVNDNNVNLRSSPDEVNGPVVGQLRSGTKVEVVEATVQSYTVAGQTGQWYRLKDPAGWVFGSFLSPAP
ncbi:MAG TPA: SH3 domain-containing protein [Rectinemataceae bacterium]|nr:SH3 domain-containing protein [Rectinemataceae bacterium]